MSYCTNCGAAVNPQDKFCRNCGAVLAGGQSGNSGYSYGSRSQCSSVGSFFNLHLAYYRHFQQIALCVLLDIMPYFKLRI